MKNFSDSYKEAGVDVTAGYKAVELMKQHVAPIFPALFPILEALADCSNRILQI